MSQTPLLQLPHDAGPSHHAFRRQKERCSTALVVADVEASVSTRFTSANLGLLANLPELHALAELDLMSPPSSPRPALVRRAAVLQHSVARDAVRSVPGDPGEQRVRLAEPLPKSLLQLAADHAHLALQLSDACLCESIRRMVALW